MKKADLGGGTEKHLFTQLTRHTSQKSSNVVLQYLRRSLGGIRVLVLLLLLSPPRRNVVHHLPFIARLVLPGHVLKFALLLGRHCLRAKTGISPTAPSEASPSVPKLAYFLFCVISLHNTCTFSAKVKRCNQQHPACHISLTPQQDYKFHFQKKNKKKTLTQPKTKPQAKLYYLPSLGALLGKLGKVNRSLRVFLLVLLPTGLHKICIGGHLPPRLGWILPHPGDSI